MPTLVRYVLTRLAIGFGIGAASALVLTLWPISFFASVDTWLEVALIVWGIGSLFALGYLATSLATETDP